MEFFLLVFVMGFCVVILLCFYKILLIWFFKFIILIIYVKSLLFYNKIKFNFICINIIF